jgi:hypothetical protein
MHSQPSAPVAATAHFVEAERLVEALPLVDVKRGEWDRQARLALVHATLAIAASQLGAAVQRQTIAEEGE